MSWSKWKPMPGPHNCRAINGPNGPGVYQIRNRKTSQLIQFGIGIKCQERMQSLFPKPFGKGTRNNESKRQYILMNWKQLEFRAFQTATRLDAKKIEDSLKSLNNHLFNT